MQLLNFLSIKMLILPIMGEKCRVCLFNFSIFPVLTNSFEFLPTQTLYCKPACPFF